MYRITYTSYTSRLFTRSSLAAITKVSRRNNLARKVTGLMVYCDRRFFQVLEGDEGTLTHLMTRIVADPRHTGVSIVDHGSIDKRAFTSWRLCCPPEDAPAQRFIPTSPLADLVPANSDLRGNDPAVRHHVRRFLAGLRELPKAATG